jgi:hypothetical protein
MTDRIRCSSCGAESFADGATLYCKTCYDNLRRELSQHVKDYDALKAENAQLREKMIHLYAALEAVEWLDTGEVSPWCPFCENIEWIGHKPDCKRQEALYAHNNKVCTEDK